MQTAIIYASTCGGAASGSQKLASMLKEPVKVYDLGSQSPEIDQFKTVVLGSGIYAGKPHKLLRSYVKKNLSGLLEKNIFLFLYSGDPNGEKYFKSFPKELVKKSVMNRRLGNYIILEKLNPIFRFIYKYIAKQKDDIKQDDLKNIKEMAAAINEN